MTVYNNHFHSVYLVRFHVLKETVRLFLWSPSLFFQSVQHIILAHVEPHSKEQVIPAGLHQEEAASTQA